MATRTKLTRSKIEAIEKAAGRQHIWDTDVPGFCVCVTEKGAKSFRLQYRHCGKSSWFTIGRVGLYTPEQARDIARKKMVELREGKNPNTVLRIERQAIKAKSDSLDKIAEKFFSRWKVKPRYKTESKGTYTRVIKPVLGNQPVQELDRKALTEVVNAVYDRGTPIAAKRVVFILRMILDEAYDAGLVDRNVARDIRIREHEKRRERVLSNAELKDIWEQSSKLGWPFGHIYRLLIVTGQRLREVASMEWSEIDLEMGVWRLPASKTKNKRNHTVYLSSHAIGILNEVTELPRISEQYVFSSTGKRPVSGFSKPKAKIDNLLKTISSSVILPWVVHDFRRTFVTALADLDVNKEVRERYVNHVSGEFSGVAGVYNQSRYERQQREAIKFFNDHFDRLIGA